MTPPAIGSFVTWTPARNTERNAVARFGAEGWEVHEICWMFRGATFHGQACALLVPPAPQPDAPDAEAVRWGGLRWVPLDRIG